MTTSDSGLRLDELVIVRHNDSGEQYVARVSELTENFLVVKIPAEHNPESYITFNRESDTSLAGYWRILGRYEP